MTAPQQICQIISSSFSEATFSMARTQKKKKIELMRVIIIIIITIIFQKCYFLFIGKRIRLLFNECTRLLMYVEGCAVLEKHLRDGEAADHSRTVLPGCYPLTNPCLPQISGWSCLDVGSVGAASIFSAVCACPVQMCPHCGGGKGNKDFFFPQRCCWATLSWFVCQFDIK